jgi:hypothetical protein
MSDERGEALPYVTCSVLLIVPGILAAVTAVFKTIDCLHRQDFSAGVVQPIVFMFLLAAVLILGGMAAHRKAASF